MEAGVKQYQAHLSPVEVRPGDVQFTIPKSRSEDILRCSPVLTRNGFGKSADQIDWVGKVDVSMYQEDLSGLSANYPPDHCGRLWYNLTYNLETERLVVTVIKARNLPLSRKRSYEPLDCFIKVCLMPDERRTFQTAIKKKTQNPNFDESFVLQINSKDVEERRLILTVHQTHGRSKPRVVGMALIGLEEIIMNQRKLSTSSPERGALGITHWVDISDPKHDMMNNVASKGQMLVSLTCHTSPTTCRFFVGIHQCQDICTQGEPSDLQVKVEFRVDNNHQKTKKTMVYHHTPGSDVIIGESIRFTVADLNQLREGNLLITLVNKSLLTKDKCLGRFCIGSSYMLAKCHGLEHWQRMLENPSEEQKSWHHLS